MRKLTPYATTAPVRAAVKAHPEGTPGHDDAIAAALVEFQALTDREGEHGRNRIAVRVLGLLSDESDPVWSAKEIGEHLSDVPAHRLWWVRRALVRQGWVYATPRGRWGRRRYLLPEAVGLESPPW
jgi:hypothetical protein